jgi:putative membrane protein
MGAQPRSEPAGARWGVALVSLLVVCAVAVVLYGMPRPHAPQAPGRLASLNALLNAASAACLLAGYAFIRRRRIAAHRRSMLTAFALSSAFLVSYLVHHAQVGSVPFRGEGPIRALYFALLVPHVVLAALIVPLALLAIYRGWTGRLEAHRRVARIALPLWLYVSLSGVVLYWMLY